MWWADSSVSLESPAYFFFFCFNVRAASVYPGVFAIFFLTLWNEIFLCFGSEEPLIFGVRLNIWDDSSPGLQQAFTGLDQLVTAAGPGLKNAPPCVLLWVSGMARRQLVWREEVPVCEGLHPEVFEPHPGQNQVKAAEPPSRCVDGSTRWRRVLHKAAIRKRTGDLQTHVVNPLTAAPFCDLREIHVFSETFRLFTVLTSVFARFIYGSGTGKTREENL